MPLPLSPAAQQAIRRASLARDSFVVQSIVDVPASTGADHLPEKYDRDAVQVALDGIVSALNESIRESRRDG